METAMKAYGRVDVIINNAGILRDVSMVKMTDMDWDLIMKVHLKGNNIFKKKELFQSQKQHGQFSESKNLVA